MKKDKDKRIQKSGKKERSMVRSSAAEYLTFVASSGKGGVEAIFCNRIIQDRLFESDFDRMIKQLEQKDEE